MARGFPELIAHAVNLNLTLVIIFDTDTSGKASYNVQRAASSLGFELRYQGVSYKNIKQLILPAPLGDKIGLDDFFRVARAPKFRSS